MGTASRGFTAAFAVIYALAYLGCSAEGAGEPKIREVVPAGGYTRGEVPVTIRGENFKAGAQVTIGGAAAPVVSESGSALVVTAPAHAAGTVDVVVTNPDGSSASLPAGYAYDEPPPVLVVVTPGAGSTNGGTTLSLGGNDFQAGATVLVRGVLARVVSTTAVAITAIAPANPEGPADVTVRNPDGKIATLEAAFTYYLPDPTIASVQPSSGPPGGGTRLRINGADFRGAATVTVQGRAAVVETRTTTQLVVLAPAGTDGAAEVRVVNPDGGEVAAPGAYVYLGASCSRPPRAQIEAPVSDVIELAPGDAISFVATCSAQGVAAHDWRLPGGQPTTASSATTGPVVYAAPGVYLASYVCTDAAGRTTQPMTRTVVVEASTPQSLWVDSILGADTNDGSSELTPLRSIEAVRARFGGAPVTVHLARGSYWRESLFGLPDGSRIVAYGAGERPVLDSADPIPAAAFTRVPSYTNVYQATVTYDPRPGGVVIGFNNRVWENGSVMTYVPDLATCEATPGSWTGNPRPPGITDVLYVHPGTGADPAVSGDTYEYPARARGIHGGQYQLPSQAGGADPGYVREIAGVHSRRHAHHDGGILSAGYVRDCVADDEGAGPTGPRHAFWVNGTAEDCVARSSGGNPFISYGNDLPEIRFRRCTAIGAPGTRALGWFFHTGGPDKYRVKRYVIEDGRGIGLERFAGGDAADFVAIIRPRTSDAKSIADYTTTHRFLLLGADFETSAASDDQGIVRVRAGAEQVLVLGSRIVTNRAAPFGAIVADTGDLTVRGSTIAFTQPSLVGGYRTGVVLRSSEGTATVHGSLFLSSAAPVSTAGAVVDADQNLYFGASAFTLAGQPISFGSWVLATGSDRHSTVADPLLPVGSTAPGDRSPACTVQAGVDFFGESLEASWADAAGLR